MTDLMFVAPKKYTCIIYKLSFERVLRFDRAITIKVFELAWEKSGPQFQKF